MCGGTDTGGPGTSRDERDRQGVSRAIARGFTLIELLITVAIIGIIAAIAIVNLQSALDKSKQKKTMSTIRSMSTAIQAYQVDNSRYPADGLTAAQLQALLSPDVFNTVDTTDGWGYDIIYTTDQKAFTVESYGKDNTDGPADITHATRFEFEYDIVLVDGFFVFSPESF